MRRILVMWVSAVFGFVATLVAADSDKQQISKRMQEFTEAFNKADGKAISSFFTKDVTISNPFTGQHLQGAKEVTQFFEKEFPVLKGKKLAFIEKKVDFPSEGRAVVQGVSELTENGTLMKQRARKLRFVKQNGVWYIDSIREIPIELPPNIFSHLKELEWMVGNWHDRDNDVSILYSTKWDKFHNFLFQHFQMDVYGLEVMEGIQIIGWDPAAKKIRSWVYDSDGGVGTGIWSKRGDSWHVKFDFTLSDGRTGTQTNIYTPRDKSSYTYASIERKIGNTKLPNIENIHVVRGE